MLTYTSCLNCLKVNRVETSGAPGGKPVCGKCGSELSIHGAVSELSASALQSLISKSPLPVVVDFWAPWCGPCKIFAPVFEESARRYSGEFAFVKVDTQSHPLASDAFQIRGIPAIFVFKNGLELERISGALPLEAFTNWFSRFAQEKKPAA